MGSPLFPQPFHGLGERSSPRSTENNSKRTGTPWSKISGATGSIIMGRVPAALRRNNEDRQRELNHNEDDLNYEILPRDIFPLGLSPFSRKIFQTRPIFLIMILLESINSKRKSSRSFFGYLFRNVQIWCNGILQTSKRIVQKRSDVFKGY